jgi:hypothetical protein
MAVRSRNDNTPEVYFRGVVVFLHSFFRLFYPIFPSASFGEQPFFKKFHQLTLARKVQNSVSVSLSVYCLVFLILEYTDKTKTQTPQTPDTARVSVRARFFFHPKDLAIDPDPA